MDQNNTKRLQLESKEKLHFAFHVPIYSSSISLIKTAKKVH